MQVPMHIYIATICTMPGYLIMDKNNDQLLSDHIYSGVQLIVFKLVKWLHGSVLFLSD